ncbi:MAG: DUF1475 family protein [Acidobacteria bacterium]|nr:DUF1475 family protein [Acidobacteriota bacterium]
MRPIPMLRLLFGAIFVFMIVATVRTSLRISLWDGGGEVLREPWSLMTLFDAYFGFLTFYVWVAYKERGWIARIVWFVLIMALGNIAMSFYMLLELYRVPADANVEAVLLRRAS